MHGDSYSITYESENDMDVMDYRSFRANIISLNDTFTKFKSLDQIKEVDPTMSDKHRISKVIVDIAETIYNCVFPAEQLLDYIPKIEQLFLLDDMIEGMKKAGFSIKNTNSEYIDLIDHNMNDQLIQYRGVNLSIYLMVVMDQKFQEMHLLRMLYVHLYTLFDEYLLMCVKLVAEKNIEMFSNSKINCGDILQCETIEEIRSTIVSKHVNELSYGSFLDKTDFLNKKGIDTEHENFDDIVLLAEIRNSIIHTSLCVNKQIISKLKKTKYSSTFGVGDYFMLSTLELEKMIDAVDDYSNCLFKRLNAKFGFFKASVNNFT